MVLLLMSVVLVPLLGKLYCEFALPLMSVDLVPRVGGVRHHHFFRTTWGTYEGALSGQPCLAGPKPLRNPGNGRTGSLIAMGPDAAVQASSHV